MNKEYILIAFTENQIGVLNRITTCYLRRKINIESLKVSESSIKGISMFVISSYTSLETITKITKHVSNFVEVLEVSYYDSNDLITQEIALYKVASDMFSGSERVDTILNQFGARMVELTPKYIVIEKTGTREEIEATRDKLDQSGNLIEFTRSGSVVLHRKSIDKILNNLIQNK